MITQIKQSWPTVAIDLIGGLDSSAFKRDKEKEGRKEILRPYDIPLFAANLELEYRALSKMITPIFLSP